MMYVVASTGEQGGFVLDLLVTLATAAAVAIGLARLKAEPIAGYLIAGAIIGPRALGLVSDEASVAQLSNLAIVLLLFLIGLSMDAAEVRGGMVPTLTVGLVSTVGSVLAAWPLIMAFGLGAPQALSVAMALSLSSTAVVLKVLHQRRELHRPYGRLTVGISLVQDLLAVVMLALLPLIEAWERSGGDGVGPPAADADGARMLGLWGQGVLGIAAIVVMLFFGRMVLPRVLRVAAHGSNSEVLVVLSAAVALSAALATSLLGFSPELGAFLAGFLLASTPFKHQLAGQLMPIRDLLMALFFTLVGLKLDLRLLLSDWWLVTSAVGLLIVGRVVAIAIPTWVVGGSLTVGVASAFALANASEFGLVVSKAAAQRGIISGEVEGQIIGVVVCTLVVAPALMALGRWLAPRLGRVPLAPWASRASALRDHHHDRHHDANVPSPPPKHDRNVVIAGYGVVGRALADRFKKAGLSVTVIEMNPRTVEQQQKLGLRAIYGDATNREVLEQAGVREAEAVVLTIPDDDASLRACRVIRSLAPRVFLATRTSYLAKGMQATQAGADQVTVEEIATAEAMEKQVMQRLGLGPRA